VSVDAVRPVFSVFGGLGSQIFQYAAGLYAEKIWGFPVDFHYFETLSEKGEDFHQLMLGRFSIRKTIVPMSALASELCDWPFFRASDPWFHELVGLQVVREVEPYCPDMRLFLKPTAPSLYCGSWQVKSYVDVVEKKLREDIVLRRGLSASAKILHDRIVQQPVSVAIHVRRGRCSGSLTDRRLLPIEYYVDAVNVYRRLSSHVRFFVFSDDPCWVLWNPLFRSKDMVVHHGRTALAHEDLFLMSQCTHQVIANSALSWWAAWLNRHPARQYTMPPFWAQGEPVPPSLLLSNSA